MKAVWAVKKGEGREDKRMEWSKSEGEGLMERKGESDGSRGRIDCMKESQGWLSGR